MVIHSSFLYNVVSMVFKQYYEDDAPNTYITGKGPILQNLE